MARNTQNLVDLDKRHVWHPFTQMAEWNAGSPVVIERGEGCYLIDTDGRRYLDGVASLWVNIHGHGRQEINQAIISQLERIAHTTLLGLANEPSILLAERLVGLAPGRLNRVFYSDSGSTAVEIALKQAFQYWQHRGLVAKRRFVRLAEAYHGDTLGAVAVGGISLFHEIFSALIPGGESAAFEVPTPGLRFDRDPARTRDTALAALRELLSEHHDEIVALIIEPLVQGAGGMLVQPEGYLRGVADLCREHQVLLIADEVATGFGRTGTMFACEQEGVEPDLMCLAKGITGGYLPLAATLSTDEVFDAFLGAHSDYKTFYHGHSYTGNPVACAAALASLDLFDTDRVLERLPARIETLRSLLHELEAHPAVLGIRQKGLMVGIEIGQNGTTLPPELATGARVCEAARNHGVMLRPLGDVVVLMPPLSISESELRVLVGAVRSALADVME